MNLQNLGVQEMNTQELVGVDGGGIPSPPRWGGWLARTIDHSCRCDNWYSRGYARVPKRKVRMLLI